MTEQPGPARLDSPDPEERRRATTVLRGHAGADRASRLLQALGDVDWRVRKEATAVAMDLAPDPEVLAGLVQALEPNDNVGLRNATVEALGGYGEPAVAAIAKTLPRLDADGRKLAAEALARSALASALGPLEALLGDADPNVRACAAEGIAAVGSSCLERAVPLLERCLSSEDRMLRLAAIGGMNQLGVSVPWTTVEKLAADPILEHSALEAAGNTADQKAAPLLAQSLETSRGTTFTSVLSALAGIARSGEHTHDRVRQALASAAPETRQRLIRLAEDKQSESDVRRDALTLLAFTHTNDAARVAVEALGDLDVAAAAEHALRIVGDEAAGVLLDKMSTGHAEQRINCLELLGRLQRHPNALVLTALTSALEDPTPDVARAALSSLSALGDASSLTIVAEYLRRELAGPVRKAASSALASLAKRHPEEAQKLARVASPQGSDALAAAVIHAALPPPVRLTCSDDVEFLSDAVNSADTMVRRAAVDALAQLGRDGMEAVCFALSDEQRDVQLAAVRALGRIRDNAGSTEAIEQLLNLLSSDDSTLVVAALHALGDTGDPRALAALQLLVRAKDPHQAVAAVEAVGRLQDAQRVEVLIEALGHAESEVVKAALRALAQETEPRAISHLGACLDHRAWDVRRLAADLLGHGDGELNLKLLRAKLGVETEPLVMEALHRSIAVIESASGVRRSPLPDRQDKSRPQ